MIRINLLAEGRRPAAVRKSRGVSMGERDWTHIALITVAVIGVLASVVYWYLLDRRRGAVQEEIAVAQAEVERLRPILEEVEEFKVKQADLERKIQVITDLKNAQTGPVRVMDAVSRGLPELLWLDRMEVSSSTIRLSGRALNVNAVSNFIENLDKVPEFKEPRVQRVNESGEVYEFTITVDYSLTPPESEIEEESDAIVGPNEAAAAAG